MKGFITTIRNIFKIEELRTRIITTLSLILIYRLGSYIVLPGVDSTRLESGAGDGGTIIDILSNFTGGAFTRASVFALGIMPYISASIIVQLLGIAVPYFQKLQKDGESGRNRLNQITRVLTIAITAVQAPSYIFTYVNPGARPEGALWLVMAVITLVAGTMFCMWLGERITDKGIGNGISLLIMIGIIAHLPCALFVELGSKMGPDGGGLIMFIFELVVLLDVIITAILRVQIVLKLPVQYANRVVSGGRTPRLKGSRYYLPLKVNQAGVMPIIFAHAIMFVPIYLAGFAGGDGNWFARNFTDYSSF